MAAPPSILVDDKPAFALIKGFYSKEKKSGAPGSAFWDAQQGKLKAELVPSIASVDFVVRSFPIHIGRQKTNTEVADASMDDDNWLLVTECSTVSRHHATIDYMPATGQWRLVCYGKNGCNVGTETIEKDRDAILHSQTSVRVGGFYFYFLLPSAAPSAQPAARAPRTLRPTLPWKDIIRRTYAQHLAAIQYFTPLDIARLAPMSCPEYPALQEGEGGDSSSATGAAAGGAAGAGAGTGQAAGKSTADWVKERVNAELKKATTLAELGFEQIGSELVPSAIKVMLKHTHAQKTWFRAKALAQAQGGAGAGEDEGADEVPQ